VHMSMQYLQTQFAADLLHSTLKSRGHDAARSLGRFGPLPVPTT
jgi:hypothetical protein